MSIIYKYETGKIELMCYFAKITGGEIKLNVHEAADWIEKSQLKKI